MELKAEIIKGSSQVLASGHFAYLTDGNGTMKLDKPPKSLNLKSGMTIKIKVLDNYNGITIYDGVVFSIFEKTVYFKDLVKQDVVQRRDDVKVYIECKSSVISVMYPELGYIHVVIQDISCGGIGISSEVKLDEKLVYSIIISFTKMPLVVKFRIIRGREKDGLYIYGCKFLNIKPAEESLLRSFVFNAQIAEKRKEEELALAKERKKREDELALAEEKKKQEEEDRKKDEDEKKRKEEEKKKMLEDESREKIFKLYGVRSEDYDKED